ncbi:hypothetical protein [Streptomyces sp. MST-110588]|uniref:hypothetical protein n=1 Tax=Streptomyces sp. MST-110588 TaxID=2833628 RepID=UPI001F5DDF89|nr:hypothetical protein [Streptomyces sp. MST-110588]UNO42437.1 hypothetical protein KGS77_26565 [Streptomyces sp. MST-110588]
MSLFSQLFDAPSALRQIRVRPDDLVLEADDHLRQATAAEKAREYDAMSAHASLATAKIALAVYLNEAGNA